MASFVNCFFISLLLFIVLDLLWFRIFAYKNIYKPQFNLINRFSRNDKKKRALLSALIAWVFMAITVSVFLVDFKPDSNNAEAFSFGMLMAVMEKPYTQGEGVPWGSWLWFLTLSSIKSFIAFCFFYFVGWQIYHHRSLLLNLKVC